MKWVRTLFVVIQASILAAVILGWIYLLSSFWALRNQFEIAARCPSLNIAVQITFIIVVMSLLLQWLLLSMGKSLPCFVVFINSCIVLAFAVAPHMIRAARLVIAFNRKLRQKYARFVKDSIAMRVWAVGAVAFFVRGAIFFGSKPEHHSRNARECFYMDDTVLEVVIAILVGPPAMFLALGISKVYDAFKIREELMATIVIGYCTQVVVISIQVLVGLKIISDTPEAHIIVEIMMLLFGINTGIWGLLIPMMRAHRHGLWAPFRGNIVYVENVDGDEVATNTEGVLSLATRGGEMAEMFGAFCRKHLCQESWDFIVDVTRYENMGTDPDAQYNAFLHILDQYLLPTSANEVNVSCASSKRMAAFGTRERFGQLDDEERRRALQEPLGEIIQMLEDNLLNKFRIHVATERDARREALTAGKNRDLMSLVGAYSHASDLGTAIS